MSNNNPIGIVCRYEENESQSTPNSIMEYIPVEKKIEIIFNHD